MYLYVYMGGYQFIGSRLSDRNVLEHQVRKLLKPKYILQWAVGNNKKRLVHWNVIFFVFLLNFKERETSMENLNKKKSR